MQLAAQKPRPYPLRRDCFIRKRKKEKKEKKKKKVELLKDALLILYSGSIGEAAKKRLFFYGRIIKREGG